MDSKEIMRLRKVAQTLEDIAGSAGAEEKVVSAMFRAIYKNVEAIEAYLDEKTASALAAKPTREKTAAPRKKK